MAKKSRSGARNATSKDVFSQKRNSSIEQVQKLLEEINLLLKKGMETTAISLLNLLLKLDPANAEALYIQGRIEHNNGNIDNAINSLNTASYQLSDRPGVFLLLAKLYAQINADRAAISALQRVLTLRPDHSRAMWCLVGIYSDNKLNEHADHILDNALKLKSFEDLVINDSSKLRVLVLRTAKDTIWTLNRNSFVAAMQEGHNNLASMLDIKNISVAQLYVDKVDESPELLRKLPRFDVIYNGITDADRCARALNISDKLCKKLDLPVINQPSAVMKTTREDNYQLFKDYSNIILPKSVRCDKVVGGIRSVVEDAIKENDFKLPIIVRLAGFQGGKHMQLVEDLETHDFSELETYTYREPQTLYVIQYHEVGFHDERVPESKLYPKFRAFLIDGKLYQAHLLVVPNNFNVRRPPSNKFFEEQPWLKEESEKFLRDPEGYLPPGAWKGLEESMRETGLDYLGIDFACSYDEEGKATIVIFEANASMRNMLHDQGPEHPIYKAYFKINSAVHEMLIKRSGVEAWDYKASLTKSEGLRNE